VTTMRERDVKRQLRALQAPGGDRARLRAIELARAELAGADRVVRDEAPEPRTRRGRRWLPPALGAIALVGFSLWAPTQGLAERIGELVGIGDPPTEKPVFETPRNQADAIVIGVGRTASGVDWETVAARYRPAGANPADSSLCFRVSFPGHDSKGSLQCLTPAVAEDFEADTLLPNAFPGPVALGPREGTVVTGIAGGDVTSVSVEAAGVRTEPEISRLTPALAMQLGTDLEAGYFVAFVPRLEGPQPRPRVSAFDAEGRTLFDQSVEVVEFPVGE
jgi:hypothetical protein